MAHVSESHYRKQSNSILAVQMRKRRMVYQSTDGGISMISTKLQITFLFAVAIVLTGCGSFLTNESDTLPSNPLDLDALEFLHWASRSSVDILETELGTISSAAKESNDTVLMIQQSIILAILGNKKSIHDSTTDFESPSINSDCVSARCERYSYLYYLAAALLESQSEHNNAVTQNVRFEETISNLRQQIDALTTIETELIEREIQEVIQ